MADDPIDRRTERDLTSWAEEERDARTARATTALHLLALVPAGDQAEGMLLVLEGEAAETTALHTLRVIWSASVRQAYLDGRADEAADTIKAMGGEPETRAARGATTH